MPKTTRSLRLIACTATLIISALAIPSAASASSSQLSMIQEDRRLFNQTFEDPNEVMKEIRALGVDIVRTNLIYRRVYKSPRDRSKPAGFVTSDPNSPQYNWRYHDDLVNAARRNGIQVLMTITSPGPWFSTTNPGACRREVCTVAPKIGEFGDFAAAVAKRYAGRVDYYSIGNEFNLGKNWLTPRFKRSRGIKYDFGASVYRKMWIAGQRSIARFDPSRRNRVFFAETAAVASPVPFIRNALCIDDKGRALRGRRAKLQGCSGRVAKLNIGGMAVHPYNSGGNGTPRQRVRKTSTLTMNHMPRLHSLMRQAVRRRRIPRNTGVYLTEFGFQTKPPDRFSNVSLSEQAQYINEADRLFFGDRRIKTVNQFELNDPPGLAEFNMGLRFVDGRKKPSYDAYRLPIVVTRRSSRRVEFYGEVRPHRILSGGPVARVSIQAAPRRGGTFTTVKTQLTNRRGFIRTNISRAGAASSRWRMVWLNPDSGETFISRVAKAGKRLKYYSK